MLDSPQLKYVLHFAKTLLSKGIQEEEDIIYIKKSNMHDVSILRRFRSVGLPDLAE